LGAFPHQDLPQAQCSFSGPLSLLWKTHTVVTGAFKTRVLYILGWWLGNCNAQPFKSDCDRDNEVQGWSAGVLGELLAIGSTLNRLPPVAHLHNLKRAIENLAAGKQAVIYRAMA
jgi:hypothetical protein